MNFKKIGFIFGMCLICVSSVSAHPLDGHFEKLEALSAECQVIDGLATRAILSDQLLKVNPMLLSSRLIRSLIDDTYQFASETIHCEQKNTLLAMGQHYQTASTQMLDVSTLGHHFILNLLPVINQSQSDCKLERKALAAEIRAILHI
jgi:hypothetical protein